MKKVSLLYLVKGQLFNLSLTMADKTIGGCVRTPCPDTFCRDDWTRTLSWLKACVHLAATWIIGTQGLNSIGLLDVKWYFISKIHWKCNVYVGWHVTSKGRKYINNKTPLPYLKIKIALSESSDLGKSWKLINKVCLINDNYFIKKIKVHFIVILKSIFSLNSISLRTIICLIKFKKYF